MFCALHSEHCRTSRTCLIYTLHTSSLGDSESACAGLVTAWAHLLSDLAAQGWEVITATDLAQKRCNSTVFFRSNILSVLIHLILVLILCSRYRKMVGQLAAEPYRPYTVLAPCSWDKLVIVNLPKSLEPRLSMLVEAGWGVQDARVIQRTRHGAALRIKMLGNPWNGETGAQGVQVKMVG